ncbi:FbpB family small basic protein [Bacillus sp. IB182487]|uniref:FbpB family small basic protein n=1 Tax=Metabacillus arenae TaxID=2771434 RepID=A0A926NG62_9BACI|nr:FbpB family small basic protein [Metabacillus arenae]MBD1382844.1 FbpB family small basic protein [Metabacillus arenae]
MRKSLKNNKSFEELVQENILEVLNDKQALEKIEKRIEKRVSNSSFKKSS